MGMDGANTNQAVAKRYRKEDSVTVKQLVKKLRHPPCERIAAVRIEFTDGGIYEVSPDTHRNPKHPARRSDSRIPKQNNGAAKNGA